MFTGLVECMARVVDVVPTDEHIGSYAVTIGESALLLGDCHVGDSIAVNGVCDVFRPESVGARLLTMPGYEL